MKKKIAIRSIAMLAIMLACILFAFVAKGFYKPSNTDRFHSIEDLRKSGIPVGDQFTAAHFEGYEDVTAEDIVQMYEEALAGFQNVMLVKPTGKIKCQYWSIQQELEVKKVLKGEGPEGGNAIYIHQGTRVDTDLKMGRISLKSYGVNLMQPEKEYLLFCDRADMSDYADEEYYVSNSLSVCYFTLDDDYVGGVNSTEVRYADLAGCEFFVDSEEAASAVAKFKKAIMEYFVTGDNSPYHEIIEGDTK